VRIIERADLDASAFTAAGVQSARALALLRQDDLGNFHAALRAQELNPELRLVVAIFNTSLGERIRTYFRDCAVLSGSSMSAPSFVAAARLSTVVRPGHEDDFGAVKPGSPQPGPAALPSGQVFPVVLQSHM
jgi:hypothetical protein